MSELPRTMTAIVAPTPGGPEALKMVERPVPRPGHGEVLIKIAAAGLNGADLSQRLVEIRAKLEPIGRDFRLLVEQLEKLKDQRPEPSVLDKVNALTAKLKELGPPNARPDAQLSIHALEAAKALFDNIQGCDAPVTPPMKAGVNEVQNLSGPAIDQWNRTIATELPALNETLRASGLPPIGGAER